ATMPIPCVVLPTKQTSSGSALRSRPASLRVSSTRWAHGWYEVTPFKALSSAHSPRTLAQSAGGGATAAWSEDAQRGGTGKWSRKACQFIPGELSAPAGGLTIEKAEGAYPGEPSCWSFAPHNELGLS